MTPFSRKSSKNKKNLIHFLNAVLHLEGDSRIKSVKHLMPTVYSIWICNFKVPFCKHFREELALYRTADVGKPHPLTIYPKKKYIIIDLTRFVPQEDNTQENQWIELFWNMPTANAMPRGIDKVVRAVYRQLLVNKATAGFITEVATDMIDRDEYNACISYARNKGLAEGEKRGKAKAKKKFATEKKKIAQFLQSKGVSVKLLNAAMAIK